MSYLHGIDSIAKLKFELEFNRSSKLRFKEGHTPHMNSTRKLKKVIVLKGLVYFKTYCQIIILK